jgi:hypothetical protein
VLPERTSPRAQDASFSATPAELDNHSPTAFTSFVNLPASCRWMPLLLVLSLTACKFPHPPPVPGPIQPPSPPNTQQK